MTTLTEAERGALWQVVGKWARYEISDSELIDRTVERIVAARVQAWKDNAVAAHDRAEREAVGRISAERRLAEAEAEAVLRGEIRRTEAAITTFEDVVADRDAMRDRLAELEAAVTALADRWEHHASLFVAPVDRQAREDWEHVVTSLRAALS